MPPCDTFLFSKSLAFINGFNPCFDGCRPATRVAAVPTPHRSSFNPCFDGCRPATSLNTSFPDFAISVSILVLMDAALRHPDHVCVLWFLPIVSILVLMDAALRHNDGGTRHQRQRVSILVLMDAALRPRSDVALTFSPEFQSLF